MVSSTKSIRVNTQLETKQLMGRAGVIKTQRYSTMYIQAARLAIQLVRKESNGHTTMNETFVFSPASWKGIWIKSKHFSIHAHYCKICRRLKVPSDGSREIVHLLLVFSTMSCLSSLVSSQIAVPCYAFFGAERA